MNKRRRYLLPLLVLLLSDGAHSSEDLFHYIEQGNIEQVGSILGQNASLLNARNDDGMTPLNYAAFLGKAGIVRELIARGADASIGDNDNSLPIHCAAIAGDTSTLSHLVTYGADIDAQDNNGMTPLMFALSYRKLAAADFLLDHNADVATTANNGMRPLHYAVLQRQPTLAERIVERGADPNTRNGNSQTPLFLALYNDDQETADILLRHGANVEDTTNDGISLLFYALAYRDSSLARQMLGQGKEFNQTNSLGMTMLHYAAARGFKDIVAVLCDKGVEVDARCTNGKTALYYATIWDHRDVADLLVQQGARPLTDEALGLSGPYLGQEPPGRQPKAFAAGRLLTPFAPHGVLVFSPDGRDIYWCHHAMPIQAMWHTSLVGDVWQRPSIASFTDPALDYADGSPCFTRDGDRLYYHSHRPLAGNGPRREDSDIWYVEKTGGTWGTPVNLGTPVNTEFNEYGPSVSNDGTLYFIGSDYDDTFGAGDLYAAEFIDGKYGTPRNLGPAINTPYHELNPAVAPDNSYLIFSSNRPSPSGGLDMFVSFKKRDGGWTEAVTFGRSVTSGNAWHPFITPDGKYVIYLRGDSYYWFSTEAVDDLREAVLGHEPDTSSFVVLRRDEQDFGDRNTRKIMLGDLDGDGDLDAVFSCGQVWLNDGRGTFTLHLDNLVSHGHGADMGDVDRDGDTDIVFAGTANRLYLNDGKANFIESEQMLGDSTAGAFHVLLADFDADGDRDLAAFHAGDSILTFVNDGLGTFALSDMQLPCNDACDLDGDGDVDFFVRKRGVGYKVMLNDGSGNFTEHWAMADSTIDYGFVAFADIDNDGDPDVIVTNGGNDDIFPTRAFFNNGSGQFALSDMVLPRTRWGNVAFGDLNSDGWVDAFMTNFTLPNCVLINDGTGRLIDAGLRLGGNAGNMISAIGDLDGDGDLDVFVSNFEGGSNQIWLNQLK